MKNPKPRWQASTSLLGSAPGGHGSPDGMNENATIPASHALTECMCGDSSSPNARNLSGFEIAKKVYEVLFKFLKSSSLGPVTGIIFQKPDPENSILPITSPCPHKILKCVKVYLIDSILPDKATQKPFHYHRVGEKEFVAIVIIDHRASIPH